MSKIAVVFWSGTGNTEAMAQAVAEGAKEKGAEVTVFTAAEFSAAQVPGFDAIAFGCPAMGAEVLEESEFQPMFDDVKPALSGKKLVLFGSYGWGTGEWMDYWKEDCVKAGAHGTNRKSQVERFRQRFMHKLVYNPLRNDGEFS